MSLNIDSIYGTVHTECPENLRHARATQSKAQETFVIDGISNVM